MLSREPQMLPIHSDHMPVMVDFIKLLDDGQVFVPIVPSDGVLANTIANRMIYPASKGRNILHDLGTADYSVLDSHCIDSYAADLFVEGKFEEFLERRAKVVSEIIEEHVQRHALFGFRDGLDVSTLFDDSADGDYVE